MHAINSVKPTATMRAQIRYPLSEVRDRFDRMNEFCHTITTKSQLRELLFRIRFATDSPLEEGVCCELVAEIGLSGGCRNKA